MTESRWFYIVALLAMVAIFFASQLRFGTDTRRRGGVEEIAELAERTDLNLLFVLIDTLRADRLGAYGYERPTSPNIDALAATGLRFARQMAQSSWTKCSMASMWTAYYPISTGVLRSPHAISEEARMPAEIFKEAGYRTSAIWRNSWIGPPFGFAQGFDVYNQPPISRHAETIRREKPTAGVVGTDQDLSRSAIEFFRTYPDERWFFYLHLMDVHQYVYDEDSALFGTSYSDIYDNSIRWVDRVIGSVIQELDVLGLREKTIIVLAADHGEAFGEHGREGHARNVYGEVVTTPLIISFPFRLEPGVVVDSQTENVDIWPTLLDLLDLPPLEGVDGRSRIPEIKLAAGGQGTASETRPRYAHIDQNWIRLEREPKPTVAVTDGQYRLVLFSNPRRVELYDQSVDVYEQREIGTEEPEALARLTELAENYLERTQAPWGGVPEVEIDESQLEQLRALGYSVQ